MSAFSRGCLLRHHSPFSPRTIHLMLPSKSFQTPRFFTSSPLLHAAKKTRPPPAVKKTFSNTKPSFLPPKAIPQTTSAPPPTYQSYATTLAQKLHPTLLYTAPSHTMFMVACYTGSTFCFSYAIVNLWSNSINPPEGLATWVPTALAGVAVFMAAFGTWLVLGPARLIKTITAIPKNPNVISTAVGKAVNPELQIEVELRKMFPLPFFPARKLYVKPEEIALSLPIAPPPPKNLSPADLREIRIEEEAEKKKLLEYERSHIMTSPFRHMSRAFFQLFKAIGRTWHREGFMKVEVKGSSYKLDVTGGWALDGGRALDRLARVKPKL
ncbi:hypothetical protein N431DRAFT_397695 [Stipitochalara longipes BDJ]|nr:hypothetical protein N431DRAFT_397695 [Stipitochalara longipes BDJ]